MKHKVYAFVNDQPFGAIGVFSTRKEAKKCSESTETHGVKNAYGKVVPAKTKIVVS